MKLFFLNHTEKPDGELWCEGRGGHVPAITCPKCFRIDTTLYAYPVVDITAIQHLIPKRLLRPEEFAQLRVLLRPLIPAHLPVQHGQYFGPMKADGKGVLGDAIPVVGHGTSCVRKEKFDELVAAGLTDLQGVEVKVRYKREPEIRIMEFQVHNVVRLASHLFLNKPCEVCGRVKLKTLKNSQTVIKRSSIPSQGCVLGLHEWRYGMIVTERFVEVASKILSNAEFVEIPIVGE